MDNCIHKHKLIDIIENVLNKIDMLPLHPKFKLEIYQNYLLPEISWHLTIEFYTTFAATVYADGFKCQKIYLLTLCYERNQNMD